MLKLQITPQDAKAAKILKPGPYRFKIDKVYGKLSKDKGEGKSMNYWFELVGLEGEAKDVPIRCIFNEKFITPIIPLLQALGQEVSEEDLTNVDLEAAQGQEVIGFVETQLYNSKPQNNITSWKKAD